MKITILITAFKEPNIEEALISALNQKTEYKYEVILSAPDKPTLDIAKEYQKKYKHLKILIDPGKGKSYALNLAISNIKTDILILTDGDVYISKNTIEEIMDYWPTLLLPKVEFKLDAFDEPPPNWKFKLKAVNVP